MSNKDKNHENTKDTAPNTANPLYTKTMSGLKAVNIQPPSRIDWGDFIGKLVATIAGSIGANLMTNATAKQIIAQVLVLGGSFTVAFLTDAKGKHRKDRE